jgi:hypothetical protein
MPPRMTITALKRGYLNALNCGLFLVGAWLLVGGMIAVVTGRESRDSLSTSFAVESFSWSPDSTLLVTVKGRFALLRRGALPFHPEFRQDVEKALKERCPSATEL